MGNEASEPEIPYVPTRETSPARGDVPPRETAPKKESKPRKKVTIIDRRNGNVHHYYDTDTAARNQFIDRLSADTGIRKNELVLYVDGSIYASEALFNRGVFNAKQWEATKNLTQSAVNEYSVTSWDGDNADTRDIKTISGNVLSVWIPMSGTVKDIMYIVQNRGFLPGWSGMSNQHQFRLLLEGGVQAYNPTRGDTDVDRVIPRDVAKVMVLHRVGSGGGYPQSVLHR